MKKGKSEDRQERQVSKSRGGGHGEFVENTKNNFRRGETFFSTRES